MRRLCGKFVWGLVVVGLVVLTFEAQAGAQAYSSVHTFALVVGSNRPGENQEALRYAQKDAERMAGVLQEIGGYDPESIVLLRDPDDIELRETIQKMSGDIAEYRRRDEMVSFVFYYSGHARSHALTLGESELSLQEMRGMLEKLPATVKLVFLDACQTGAFSRVKGAKPAVDFSHNSVEMLHTAGMAVMASSTASELSQESDTLEGSFFTHHLVAGLRGAADEDRDGKVSLHEAYGYAYDQTLVATAGTAVGKQHITLETELSGTGEMVLTWPSEASSKLILPADLTADVLVYRVSDRTVQAEIYKAAGAEVALAFAPDEYQVLIREDKQILGCEVRLVEQQETRLDLKKCEEAVPDQVVAKQASPIKPKRDRFRWLPLLELTVGGLLTHEKDAYIERLDTFGYSDVSDGNAVELYYSALLGVHVNRFFSLGVSYSSLDHADSGDYRYSSEDVQYAEVADIGVGWRAHRFGLEVRGSYPVVRDRIIPFVQLGVGASVAKTTWNTARYDYTEYEEVHWGYSLSGGVGLIGMLHRSVGLIVQGDYIYAPAITNLYDENHNSGGFAFYGGVRVTL